MRTASRVLEFPEGETGKSRPPCTLRQGIQLVGASAACDIVVSAAGVAPRHATIVVDELGAVFVEPVAGTVQRNGQPIVVRERLVLGDLLAVGTVVMRLGAATAASDVTLPPQPAPQPALVRTMAAAEVSTAAAGPVNSEGDAAAAATEAEAVVALAHTVIAAVDAEAAVADAASHPSTPSQPVPIASSGDAAIAPTTPLSVPVPPGLSDTRSPLGGRTETVMGATRHARPSAGPESTPAASAPTDPALAESSPAPISLELGAPGTVEDTAPAPPSFTFKATLVGRRIAGGWGHTVSFALSTLAMAWRHKVLFEPFLLSLALGLGVSLGAAVLLGTVVTDLALYGLLLGGTLVLAAVLYLGTALTMPLLVEELGQGDARLSYALGRLLGALGRMVVLAGGTLVFGVLADYGRERHGSLGRMLARRMARIWTTATYVLTGAVLLEDAPLGVALERSRAVMEEDPTGVDAGSIPLSLTCHLASMLVIAFGWMVLVVSSEQDLVRGGLFFFLSLTLLWSFTGWLRQTYAACFYLWARECAQRQSRSPQLAPQPLRIALRLQSSSGDA